MVIFTAIFLDGYPGCQCYVSTTVEGCITTDGVVSSQSADHANLGDSSASGRRRSGGLAWNGLLPFGGYISNFGLL